MASNHFVGLPLQKSTPIDLNNKKESVNPTTLQKSKDFLGHLGIITFSHLGVTVNEIPYSTMIVYVKISKVAQLLIEAFKI